MKLFSLFLALAGCLAAQVSKESQTCINCHQNSSPGIVGQWKQSKHFESAIGCRRPCHPTLMGPILACMWPITFLSKY